MKDFSDIPATPAHGETDAATMDTEQMIFRLVAAKAAASARAGQPMGPEAIAKMTLDLHKMMSSSDLPVVASLDKEPKAAPAPKTWKGERAPDDPFCAIEDTVQDDYIVCLENGRHLSMLKRHLNETYGMTPAEYRAKWGLPDDYPMTAPNYTAKKASAAFKSGLGRHARSAKAVLA
ncbi:hypothetical protein AYJ57_21560 (plasmid) [Salipiger sp. CCB-MM3]|uniref:MucR family transcriptional regulator n=1 Tax=Salipiger sp. CCB-MM3 TaxID=1792508 RepID=UPI00080AB682|nr:MucR family transcriptional regulator [Salipiger sp. CCB-MM3]ANT63062.1 hypothetical protein AYJ57_21560 [Salipiger sp. CCB-MM3]